MTGQQNANPVVETHPANLHQAGEGLLHHDGSIRALEELFIDLIVALSKCDCVDVGQILKWSPETLEGVLEEADNENQRGHVFTLQTISRLVKKRGVEFSPMLEPENQSQA